MSGLHGMVWIRSMNSPFSENPLFYPRHSAWQHSFLILDQSIAIESSGCPNFGSISSRLIEGDSKLKVNGGGLEGGGSVDAHRVSAQVSVCSCWVERAGNRSCEPVDSDLVHEVGKTLTGLQLVLAQHVLRQLSSRNEGG